VEKNILDLAYHRGQSLYAEDKVKLNEDVTIVQPKAERLSKGNKQKGDFVARYYDIFQHLIAYNANHSLHSTDDMLAVMFPHLYLPLEDDIETQVTMPGDMGPANAEQADVDFEMAGPSRS
jgi:hypothetical protein